MVKVYTEHREKALLELTFLKEVLNVCLLGIDYASTQHI